MAKAVKSLSTTFNALGDPTRFELFKLISGENTTCVSQLAEKLDISPACVSQHMKILADAGLVDRIRNGQRVCYQVANDSEDNKVLSKLIFKK
jgi:ArsR family transcriptional regulator